MPNGAQQKQMKQFDWLITISRYASFKAIIAVRTYQTIQTLTIFLLVQIYKHYMIKIMFKTMKQFPLPHMTCRVNWQGKTMKL